MNKKLLDQFGNSNHGSSSHGHEEIRIISLSRRKFSHTYDTLAVVIASIQCILIVLFGILAESPSQEEFDDSIGFGVGYFMFSGVLIMMFVGFGYLVTFMKDFAFGGIGFTMLLTAIVSQWSLVTLAIANNIASAGNGQTSYYSSFIELDIYSLLNSLFCVAAVLISYGGIIGKLSPLQLVTMAMIETVVYSINGVTILDKQYNYVDPGGTISIHTFGAYFGLSVSYVLGVPNSEPKGMYINDQIAFLGTLFLWIYWPSFVGGSLPANSVEQQRAVVNTYLSLASSTVMTFSFSKILSSEKKFRAVDIQNATLAGGVAIGAVASLSLSPFTPLLIGAVAGSVSCFGFNVIQPYLLKVFNIHDTCGIHNLHGMPSLIGGVASVILAIYKDTVESDSAIYGINSGHNAALYQFASVVTTLAIAIGSGLGTGWILIMMGSENEALLSNKYQDHLWWQEAEEEAKEESDH